LTPGKEKSILLGFFRELELNIHSLMHYPVEIIAYIQTDQGDVVNKREIITSELEHINFQNRYSQSSKIKYRELTEEELTQLGLSKPVFRDEPLNKPINPTTTSTTPIKPPKTSLAEKITWIVSIAAGLVAIYEFIIKRFL
jgi:hypothetical protein